MAWHGTASTQVRVRQPQLLRFEHPPEPRLPAQVEALQLVHGVDGLRPVPRHHAGCELEGEFGRA